MRKVTEMNPSTRDVGLRIREARENQGMSQVDLAEAMRVAKTTIGNWENGFRVPGSDDIIRLAKILGKRPGWFFGDDDVGAATVLREFLSRAENLDRLADLLQKGADLAGVEPAPQELERLYPELSPDYRRSMYLLQKALPSRLDRRLAQQITDQRFKNLLGLFQSWVSMLVKE